MQFTKQASGINRTIRSEFSTLPTFLLRKHYRDEGKLWLYMRVFEINYKQ